MSIFDKFYSSKKDQQADAAAEAQGGDDAIRSDGTMTSEEVDALRKKPITSDMIVGDIITLHPEAADLLMQCGMGCISCPASLMESLADACMVHALNGEEVTEYMNESLNLA